MQQKQARFNLMHDEKIGHTERPCTWKILMQASLIKDQPKMLNEPATIKKITTHKQLKCQWKQIVSG